MGHAAANAESRQQSGSEDWQQYGQYRARLLHRESVAEHVNSYIVEKPDGFEFRPGQAVDLCIDQEGWRETKHPLRLPACPAIRDWSS